MGTSSSTRPSRTQPVSTEPLLWDEVTGWTACLLGAACGAAAAAWRLRGHTQTPALPPGEALPWVPCPLASGSVVRRHTCFLFSFPETECKAGTVRHPWGFTPSCPLPVRGPGNSTGPLGEFPFPRPT